MKLIKSLLFVTLIAAAFFVTGCGKKRQLPSEVQQILDNKGSWLRLGLYGDPLSLNPIAHIESEHGQLVNNFVHASPLRKLQDGTFAPYLFDSYTIYPGSSGSIILEGVWKNGLKWHDGTEFDPKDLEFTFEQMKKSENSCPYHELLKGIESLTSFGRGLRTRIVFKQDSRKFLDLLTVGILPSHIIKEEAIDSVKVEKAGLASSSWPLFIDEPVGLGPFRVEKREKGQYLKLQPFADFFDTASRTPVLLCSYFDYQQLVSDFRGKKLDWISLPSMVASQLETMKIENLFYINYPNPACMTWIFNMRHPMLANSALRQALDLLADRNKVKNESPFTGEMLFSSPLASPTSAVADYEQRFAQAVALLDGKGWKDTNGDGIREINGQKLQILIAFNDDNLLRRAVAEKLAEDCRRAGIALELKPVSWSELVSQHLKKGDFDTALISLKLPAYGNWGAFFHSQGVGGESGLNFSGIADPEFDQMLEQMDSMVATDTLDTTRHDIAKFLEVNRPLAFLFRPYDVGIMHGSSGRATAAAPIWDDVLNWKVLFGPPDSKL